MRPMPNDSLKYLEKHEKGILFPIFCAKAVFALKGWEILKKKLKYPWRIQTLITFDQE